MTKLIVVEARRLLPIAVLFLMLIAVSIYDGLIAPAAPVSTTPNSVPYKTLFAAAQDGNIQSKVVTSLDMWVAMHEAMGIDLTDHDFNPQDEIAVFLINCQLRSTRESEGVVELAVTSRKDSVQLVLFQRAHLANDGNLDFKIVSSEKDN